jgi:hypothetical protein
MATTATLDDFEQLLHAARNQPEPQRLLLVFARRELGAHATPAERASFERGQGGHLQPCLCVDKLPVEIANFAALASESERTGQPWDIVFVGSLEGRGGVPPNSDEADQPLRFMVNAINDGRVDELAAFDRSGQPLRFV